MLVLDDAGIAVDPHRAGTSEETIGFGEPLLAPAAGEVASAVDGIADDGKSVDAPAGNHVVIDIGGGRFVLVAHLQEGSVAVKPGDRVATGDPIGRVGHSGNSTMPHIHLQVQDGPTLEATRNTFPIAFAASDGSPAREHRSPWRGEVIHPSRRAPHGAGGDDLVLRF